MTMAAESRGKRSTWLWRGLWFCLGVFVAVLVIDAVQRSVPAPVWALWFLPLAVLVPGLSRDRLRSITWLCFVTLMYFVMAVLRIFAEPQSPRAIVELLAIIALFTVAMFYVRERGRELNRHDDTVEASAAPHSEE